MTETVTDRLRFQEAWRLAEEDAGRQYGAEIVALPPSQWRLEMTRDSKNRSYGTLSFLLDMVHQSLEEQPVNARELSLAVLAFVDEVDVPDPAFRIVLQARAWKEHANALRVTGEMAKALKATE